MAGVVTEHFAALGTTHQALTLARERVVRDGVADQRK